MADTVNVNASTFLAVLFALISIVLAIFLFFRSYFYDASLNAKLAALSNRLAVLQASASTAQHMLSLDTYDLFMRVYQKPVLSSLSELQALLTAQVRSNFLHRSAVQQMMVGKDEVDGNWQIYMFAHSLAEFMAWLEIFRVHWQKMRVSNRANEVNQLLEDIKKQFEDSTEIQGVHQDANRAGEGDRSGYILQLHFGELQAIANVMLVTTRDETSQLSFRVPMAIDEFLRAISVRPPPYDAPYHLQHEWVQSFDHKLQTVLTPLLDELTQLVMLDESAAPTKRLAIIQVLVCKLIDILDPGVPWDIGPEYDDEESRPVVARNERLTPLVRYLSPAQRAWLAERPYFKYSDPNLSFPGFRQDLVGRMQEDRDTHPELWPGACPPHEPRRRPPAWRKAHPFLTQRAPLGGWVSNRKLSVLGTLGASSKFLLGARSMTAPGAAQDGGGELAPTKTHGSILIPQSGQTGAEGAARRQKSVVIVAPPNGRSQ